MLKRLNDDKKENKKNINKELIRKFTIDYAFVVILLFLLCYIVTRLKIDENALYLVFFACILVVAFAFHSSTNTVKKYLINLVNDSADKTKDELINIVRKNNSQKEINNISKVKINDIKRLIENLQKNSDDMQVLTDKTREKTDKSIDFTNSEFNAVKTNIEKMFSIRHKIQTIAELILELSDFVQSISSTIGLVEDIAEQTNLLALNAAVEAARAGEHGKGFAVVASEIRKLADESKQSTSKIIALINDIQQTANSTVLATEEGTKEIESGLELAHAISEDVEQLITAMNEVSDNMEEIIISAKKMNNDTKRTENFMGEISQMLEKSNLLTLENDESYERIEIASNDLRQSIV